MRAFAAALVASAVVSSSAAPSAPQQVDPSTLLSSGLTFSITLDSSRGGVPAFQLGACGATVVGVLASNARVDAQWTLTPSLAGWAEAISLRLGDLGYLTIANSTAGEPIKIADMIISPEPNAYDASFLPFVAWNGNSAAISFQTISQNPSWNSRWVTLEPKEIEGGCSTLPGSAAAWLTDGDSAFFSAYVIAPTA